MGYRSDVAAVVATRTKEDLQGIIDALPEGTWETIKPHAEFRKDGTRVYFQFEGWKWYTDRALGFHEEGFDVANSVEELIRTAENLNENYENDEEPSGIASSGALVRVGEESNDCDEWSWTGFTDGLPYSGDLIYISTAIIVGEGD